VMLAPIMTHNLGAKSGRCPSSTVQLESFVQSDLCYCAAIGRLFRVTALLGALLPRPLPYQFYSKMKVLVIN